MLIVLVIGALVAGHMVAASPYVDNQANAQVLQFDTSNLPNSYQFHYDSNDGSSRTEQGVIQNAGTNDANLQVHGAVRWYDDKGHLYEMTYKAGRRGYRTIIKQLS